VEFRVLRRLFPADPNRLSGEYYAGRSKLKVHLGEDIFERLRGKTVVDFGCGQGHQTIEIAQQGAALSIGVDVREELLVAAGEKAAGVPNATFLNSTRLGTTQFADFVLSIDAFEHFADPGRGASPNVWVAETGRACRLVRRGFIHSGAMPSRCFLGHTSF